ncbi:MAG: putative succinyldiaminopimelate transaminase DapC [Actinomycetota bacterium]
MTDFKDFLVPRMHAHSSSIFGEMSALATQLGAINLGQGFPDTDGSDRLKQAAINAIQDGRGNQYPPAHGLPQLRQAIAEHQKRFYGIDLNWQTDVVVTTGASEALQAALLALVDVDDEVLMFEPWFDIYEVGVELARGKSVGVACDPATLRPDFDNLRKAITNKSKILLINSPHNPTGIVWTKAELQTAADIAIEHNLIVISDEAYEHLWYDSHPHIPISTLPGMFERTVTIGSAGKSFSFTGWKVGWATGPAKLIGAVKVVRQHLSYVSSGPFQWAITEGLGFEDSYWENFRHELQAKRDLFTQGLADIGFGILPSEGTYFLTTDVRPLGFASADEFCRSIPQTHGVVAIAHSWLSRTPGTATGFVRWAYCKQESVLTQALERLQNLHP